MKGSTGCETASGVGYFFWCGNCRTTVTVRTAELRDDDSRDVVVGPPMDVPCPMCGHIIFDYDELACRGETPLNDDSWEAFEKWHEKKSE